MPPDIDPRSPPGGAAPGAPAPPPGSANTRWVLALLLLGLGVAAMFVFGGFGRLGFTRDVKRETVFFRMVTHLVYRDRPLDIEIVVGCGVRVTRYRDGGSSIDAGRFPARYAMALEGGHAVEVRSLAVGCGGSTTANGGIRPDVLPLVIWYEDSANMALGTLYATDDAYANPNARLAFRGAEVHRATRAEFDAWLATAPDNLIPRPYAQSMSGAGSGQAVPVYSDDVIADPTLYNRRYRPPDDCYAMARIKMPDVVRDAVRAFWPESRPQYWVVPRDKREEIWTLLLSIKENGRPALYEGHHLLWHYPGGADRPLQTRKGSGDHGASAVHPLRSDIGFPWLTPEVGRGGVLHTDVDVGPDTLGFANCFDGSFDRANPILRKILDQPMPAAIREALKLRVNGIEAEGELVASDWIVGFERDEYVLRGNYFK